MSGENPSSSFFNKISANKFFSGGSKFIIIEENTANICFTGKNSFIGVRVNKGKIAVSGDNVTVMAYQNNGEITTRGKGNIAKAIDTNFQGRIVITNMEPTIILARRAPLPQQLGEPEISMQRYPEAPRRVIPGLRNPPGEVSLIESRGNLQTRNENGFRIPRLGTRESHESGLRIAVNRNRQLPQSRRSGTRVLLRPLPQQPQAAAQLITQVIPTQPAFPSFGQDGKTL
jgi:hypothetical protein